MNAVSFPAAPWRRHPLHATARDWPETNCYADLWISLLHLRGMEPTAMLGFTAAMAWEGDQFTFFKPPPGDLRLFYGAVLRELALYEDLEAHVSEAVRRDEVVLLEVDAWFLPDTEGTAYRREHTKTTIGILAIDPAQRRLSYLHNAGRFELAAGDYDGVLGRGPRPEGMLFPYAESVRFLPGRALEEPALRAAARRRLAEHVADLPTRQPVPDFLAALPRHLEALARCDAAALHRFSFNTLRQFGAACELLSRHLLWLDGATAEAEAAQEVSSAAKALQFVLARQLRRGVTQMPNEALQRMTEMHERLLAGLSARTADMAGT